MADNTVTFSLELAQQLYNSENQFPVSLDKAWQWLGYSRKTDAKIKLKNHFEDGLDFCSKSSKSPTGGRPSECIMLTVDCFKSMGMMAGTEKGKEIRKYFLECERIAKSTPLISQPQRELPQTYLEALKALVEAEEEKERLKQEAEALALENSELIGEVAQLSEVCDELFDYSSIIRIAKFNGISETHFGWRSLKKVSHDLKLEVKKVPCPRYEVKNLYHHRAWMAAYPWAKLPEVTQLTIYSDDLGLD